MKEINSMLWDEITDNNPNILKSRNYKFLLYKEVGTTKIFIGNENSTNNKCLAFMAKRELYKKKEFSATDGLEVSTEFFENDEKKDAIVLKLVKGDYFEVFFTLVQDLLFYTNEKTKEEEFIESFFSRLGIWELFFKNADARGMGPEKQRGLFGELYFLNEVLLPNLGKDSLHLWVGPEQASHDIQAGDVAVEIKTSAMTKSEKIHISSERQLDDQGFKNLFVYQLSIAVRRNFHPTLVDMINAVREKINKDGTLLIHFNNLLLKEGYIDRHKSLYESEGFHVEKVNQYKVEDGFPRLIGSDMLPGLGSLKYTVDLSSIEKFRIDNQKFLQLLKETYERN